MTNVCGAIDKRPHELNADDTKKEKKCEKDEQKALYPFLIRRVNEAV